MILSGAGAAGAAQGPVADRGALLTSAHAVYAVGEPIDLTVWIKAEPAPAAPALEVRDAQGRPVPERAGGRRRFAAEVLGGATPGVNTLVSTTDLRTWFDLDRPGDYTVRLVGTAGGANAVELAAPLTLTVRRTVDREPISLGTVWALDMPGTRPVQRIPKGDPPADRVPALKLVDEIRAALARDAARDEPAGPGSAAAGADAAALREAHAVLVKGLAPATKFPEGQPLTLVVASRTFGSYFHVVGVERRDSTVEVRYRFVPHAEDEVTAHLALIPLPGPPPGGLRVTLRPLPDVESRDLDWGRWPQRIVCASYQITIVPN
jgi:hypothetical protein